jgi:hypothetical protein
MQKHHSAQRCAGAIISVVQSLTPLLYSFYVHTIQVLPMHVLFQHASNSVEYGAIAMGIVTE